MMKFKIPLLPLSAIVFYFLAVIFVQIGIFPQPDEAIKILENLYTSYGLIGLFVAAFFEGLVYVGLYFAVSLINYVLGRYIISKNLREKKELEKERKISSGLVLSALHPNSLAFYFFNLGLKKESPWKVIFIPLILIPYGFLLAYLFYQLKPILTKGAETPYILVTVLVIWFIIALILKNKNEI